jgi:aromatic-L-amino-acid/L-tryptophan decarboxylase
MNLSRDETEVAGLREQGARILAWIEDYLADPSRYPVLSRMRPGETRAALPGEPPATGERLEQIIDDFERRIVPGITHWNHPSFFGYFAISSSPPGILAELLMAALDVNGMLWRTSPAATELEELTLDWLRQMLGFPEGLFGIICDTASMSTMLALAAARERAAPGVRDLGLAGRAELPRLRVYCSTQAHSSVDKAAIALGLGLDNVVRIETDDRFRMEPRLLAEAVARDVEVGFLPVACVATAGTTSTTSVDPVPAIADICSSHGLWLHIDAAYAGAAAVVPELRASMPGFELADSIVVNPHKWLFTPIDCSALYLRDGEALRNAFTVVPDYLATAEQAPVVNFMDYGVQLGRRFRALKLWMVIRSYGVEGLVERIRGHVAMAQEFAGWVGSEPGWELCAPHPYSVVCFRYVATTPDEAAGDAINERIMDRVNASGEAFLSHTRLRGRFVLRLAIGNVRTRIDHVRRAWELLRAAAEVEGAGRTG